MSKNGISFLLREVIYESGASGEAGATVRAHSIRVIATSSAFFMNWSIARCFGCGFLAIQCCVYFFLF